MSESGATPVRAAAESRNAGPVAAIDCGTNSTRLLVLGPSHERLARRMKITRLGAGVDRTGRLDPEAIARTLNVLEEYRAVLEEHGVVPSPIAVRAAATSAVRDAENAGEFLRGAEETLGVRPEIIEGTEEGALSYFGATAELDHADGPYLVVDIGGGSTELVVGAPGGEGDARPAAVVSLDVGCVRVSERYLVSDPPTGAEMAAAHAHVRSLIDEASKEQLAYRTGRRLIGLAGTVSALTVMVLGLEEFDEREVHHARITRRQIGDLACRLAAAPLEERRLVSGMEVERADVIVGGAIVLEEVMDAFGFAELTASEADILDGIALRLLAGRTGE